MSISTDKIGQSVLLRNNYAPVCTAANPCVVPSSGGEEGANLVVGIGEFRAEPRHEVRGACFVADLA